LLSFESNDATASRVWQLVAIKNASPNWRFAALAAMFQYNFRTATFWHQPSGKGKGHGENPAAGVDNISRA
jgi:hypothetical protein